MAYSRVVSQLIADYPHADGHIDTLASGRLGIGRDWEAREPRENGDWGNTPDVWGQYGWDYGGIAEYIEVLQGIAPLGTFTRADMELGSSAGQWTVENGTWRASSAAGLLKHEWLHYYDGRPGRLAADAEGRVVSVDSLAPNLQVNLWRMGGAHNDTEPAWVLILFTNPLGSQQYGFVFPALDEADASVDFGSVGNPWFTQPLFFGWPDNETLPTVIDPMSAGSAPRLGKFGAQPTFQMVRIEYLDGAVIVRDGDDKNPWVFAGDWRSVGGQTIERVYIGPGPVKIAVCGHTVMAQCFELDYPASVIVRPRKSFVVSRHYQETAAYKVVGQTPGASTITIAQEDTGLGSRPKVTFASSNGQRPILYCVQEYREPVFSAGDTDPHYSQGDADFQVLSMRGQINENWRGSTCEVEIEARVGAVPDILQASAKVQAMVNVHDGATNASYDWTDPITSTPYSLQFTGYALPDEFTRIGREKAGKSVYSVTAADLIEARLRDNELVSQCSFEGNGTSAGWNIRDAFVYLLNCAGVPGDPAAGETDGLISIDSEITYAGMGTGYYLPHGTARAGRKLKFRPDTDYVSALDELVSVCGMPTSLVDGAGVPNCTLPGGITKTRRGLQWGVGQDGIVFLRPAYEHVAGEYDVTLDDDTTTLEYITQEFRATRSLQDWRNLLCVMVGEGIDATAMYLYDEASWSTDTAANFCGHVRARFAGFPDASDLDAIAQQLWEDIAWWNYAVSWQMQDCPWLMPGNEVRMSVEGVNVNANAIYRITSKTWEAGSDGRYRQTLEAVNVGV
jgi:hypothetical protein